MAGGLMLVMLALTAAVSHARTAAATNCRKMVLEGEVSTGKEWKSAIGQGWVFRVLPIAQEKADYSGWDLVVDRAQGAGFPDALLLATLPYNSINEREVGTTFGLRAQDAIGWNPRSFRFLSTPAALSEGQQIFRSLSADGSFGRTKSGDPKGSPPDARALGRLLELQKQAAAGEFRILDARLIPGVSDPAAYGLNWALASARTPHQVDPDPSGKSTPLGKLNWIRFSITLWLPAGWSVPPELHGVRAACPE